MDTCGGLNLVGITTEFGVTTLLITEKSKYLISNVIEAPRMIHEEGLERQGFVVNTFPWYEDQESSIVKEIVGEGPLGSDAPFPNAMVLPEEVAKLRYSLTPEEQKRYRWLGKKVSMALEKTMMKTKKGEKESAVVGRLCKELWKNRIDPVTLMSAADDRISNFRHPIPTEKRIEKYRDVIAAMDFFTVHTLTFRVLYCFFVIEHRRRRILHLNVTDHPTGPWIVQQLRDAFPESCP